MKTNNDAEKDLQNLFTINNNIDDIIYVCDPETYELLYVNEAFLKNWEGDVIGKKCYEVLQNLDAPCKFCTNKEIFGESEKEKYIWEFQNLVTKKWYKCIDRSISWHDGRKVRMEVARDISELKAAKDKVDMQKSALAERYKELNCNYEIARQLIDVEIDIGELFDKIVSIIQKSMLYPEITLVKINFNDTESHSDNWKNSKWSLSENFIVDKHHSGNISIAYDDSKEFTEDPFLDEERQLIKNISTKLMIFFKRKLDSENLKKYKSELEELVRIRNLELEKTSNSLEKEISLRTSLDKIVSDQTSEIMELTAPVTLIKDGILLASVVGTFDAERADIFADKLLKNIEKSNARIVLIDITGVPEIDTQTAQNLIDTISSAKLLGAKVILTGVRPAIAQTIIHLGIDLSDIESQFSLSAGLEKAEEIMKTEY